MKATLEFDLEDLDDRRAHIRCTKSLDAFIALSQIMEHFRQLRKYTDEKDCNIEKTEQLLWAILAEHNIDLTEEL